SELTSFVGAGIYAIYYTGNHPAYETLADLNRDNKFLLPISEVNSFSATLLATQ
ncbi:Eco29kI family restriction endonuclease, partial [Enterobacter cloacae]